MAINPIKIGIIPIEPTQNARLLFLVVTLLVLQEGFLLNGEVRSQESEVRRRNSPQRNEQTEYYRRVFKKN